MAFSAVMEYNELVAKVSYPPAWRHSGSCRSANKGKPLATSTSEILMQKVIKQFSIRRLLRLDLTNYNAAPLSGYECIGRA